VTDYGLPVQFGAFITPSSKSPVQTVDLALLAERVGLDFATFQDHPYQPAFLDSFTLMSFLAAKTDRIRFLPSVANLPLRQPVVLARAAASLDILSNGRFELGLGAGAFWDAIEASGEPRLTPGESVTALEEGIRIIREVWAVDKPGGVRVDGQFHRAIGAKRGPAPVHDMGIWLGALKPRMLRLTGRAADGVIITLARAGGRAGFASANSYVDEGALQSGRDPRAIRRMVNVQSTDESELLASLVLESGATDLVLASDDAATIERFALDVAPEVLTTVEKERGR
jgi:alkanesulfonate monooxygenase SsuD/methylene tetrahydromethanopterin reductase-like flavin-dependent oxidoreductase (luciferase family)